MYPITENRAGAQAIKERLSQLLGYQSRPASSWCPAQAGVPSPVVRKAAPSPQPLLDGGQRRGLGTCASDGRCLPRFTLWGQAAGSSLCWLSLLQTGAAPCTGPSHSAVHHAPGGLAATAAANETPALPTGPPAAPPAYSGNLHRPSMPPTHGPRQQRPVASGRGPRLSVQGQRGPEACQPIQRGFRGTQVAPSWGRSLWSPPPLAVGQLERFAWEAGWGWAPPHLHLSFCEPFTPGLSSASPVTQWGSCREKGF